MQNYFVSINSEKSQFIPNKNNFEQNSTISFENRSKIIYKEK